MLFDILRRKGIETWSVETILDMEHFSGKSMQKICTVKLLSESFLILVNSSKQETFKQESSACKKRVGKRNVLREDYQKP